MKLSIVIAATELEPLTRCLQALRPQVGKHQVEIVLVHRERPYFVRRARDLGFFVAEVKAVPEAAIFAMRRSAFRVASGDRIGSLDEHYQAGSGWVDAALSPEDWDVLTGAVEAGGHMSLSGWSAYLAEYAHLLKYAGPGTLEASRVARVPGGNAIYRRDLVQDIPEGNEAEFHTRLAAGSSRFRYSKQLTTIYSSPPSWRRYAAERYAQSFAWGAGRARGHNVTARLLLAVSRLALPAVLVMRRAAGVFSARRYRLTFLLALPLIALFTIVEMAGEISGILNRSTGDPARLDKSETFFKLMARL